MEHRPLDSAVYRAGPQPELEKRICTRPGRGVVATKRWRLQSRLTAESLWCRFAVNAVLLLLTEDMTGCSLAVGRQFRHPCAPRIQPPFFSPGLTMRRFLIAAVSLFAFTAATSCLADVGVGAAPVKGAEVIIDGSRELLTKKWKYWEGPRFASSMPIKWKIVDDPVDSGTVLMTDDPAAAGGKYGTADIVTKKNYRDFRLHIEFLVSRAGGNSGVYLQNRYEIQVLDGDRTKHGMGAVINETESPYDAYNGVGKWNAYDIVFRAARFKNGQRVEKALVSMYFNGKKVHDNVRISKVWGGPNSGVDGGNDNGFGITDTPQGLKLQCEGHDVRYRNTWIKRLDLKEADTDFTE